MGDKKTDPTLLAHARAMRHEPTPAERKLWSLLRAKRFEGVKFTRQVPIGPYIADFAARRAKLVIELDGDGHGAQERYDARRTRFLEEQGYRVIRFANADVTGNEEGVAAAIGVALGDAASPLPIPLPVGERGL